MAGLYIVIILLFRIVQALFNKRSSIEIQNIPMLIGYGSYKNTISALLGLLLIIMANNGFQVDWLTVLIAGFSGLSLFFSQFCSIYAMKSGTVSLVSLFSTAGMMIPIAAGVFFFNKPAAPMQFAGLAIFFAAACLLVSASKSVYSNFSYKTVWLLIGSMVSNGCTMLAQQMFTTYVPHGDVSVFSFFSFGIIAILSGCFYKFVSSDCKGEHTHTKMSKSLILCGMVLAVSVFVINQLATVSTALVSPIVLFTFINGGGTIVSALIAAIVYKEKISKKTGAGILIGTASLVMIKAFEYH